MPPIYVCVFEVFFEIGKKLTMKSLIKNFGLTFALAAAMVVRTWGSVADSTTVCPDAPVPVVSSEKSVSCSGQPVLLRAAGCEGTVVWSNKKTGPTLMVYPTKTTTYSAYCQKENCKTADSKPYTVEINIPGTPIVNASAKKICYGQSVTLSASGCGAGQTIWSDGSLGNEITVSPKATTKYTATCRVDGCVSCFAEDVVITVLGAPIALSASSPTACAGEAVVLSAAGVCVGQIKWSDGSTGLQLTVRPTTTTAYTAQCNSEGCEAIQSSITLQVALPIAPAIIASKTSICQGEQVRLSARNCAGTVRWSNGATGATIDIKPQTTTTYTAFCEQGSCRSVESSPMMVSVAGTVPSQPNVLAQISNRCPFITVDLSSAIQDRPAGITFEARTGAAFDAPMVENVGAAPVGQSYYIFAKNAQNCYSAPAEVKVLTTNCREPIVPVCMNNPAVATIQKTEKTSLGNYFLTGNWGGAATSATWSTNGTGVFNSTTLRNVVYIPSDADRAAGSITIAFTTNDPDSTGSCKAATATAILDVKTPERPKEMIGLSKAVQSLNRVSGNVFEIEYSLKVSNLGSNNLLEVKLIDSLDKTFKNGVVIVGKPKVGIFDATGAVVTSGWAADTTFTGQNGNYDLTIPNKSALSVGQTRVVSIKVQIDVTNAQDSVFYNTAYATALDINGSICRDISASGQIADLDGNGNPTDDSTPTPISLQALQKDDGLFIPEGFSPNGDGINDLLIVRKPNATRVSLEIYNRWGGLIYSNEDYKNDWNGTLGGKSNELVPVGTYFYVLKTSDGRELSRFLTITR
jgi:gliding motility-associated-like protein